MGFFSTIFGFFGFGIGTSIGLVVGYFLFIHFQPTDVKVHYYKYVCILEKPNNQKRNLNVIKSTIFDEIILTFLCAIV